LFLVISIAEILEKENTILLQIENQKIKLLLHQCH